MYVSPSIIKLKMRPRRSLLDFGHDLARDGDNSQRQSQNDVDASKSKDTEILGPVD
jgi:hypothetical protein